MVNIDVATHGNLVYCENFSNKNRHLKVIIPQYIATWNHSQHARENSKWCVTYKHDYDEASNFG